MVRVRACSTVRGFKCVGHNKEFQSCDSSLVRPPSVSDSRPGARQKPPLGGDVDVVDPYSEDRRIAMRQLYQDYEVEVPEAEQTSPLPHVRPAVPAPPREPIVIAQYARRFPQPPAGEGLHIEEPGVRNSVDLSHENDAVAPAGPPSRSEVVTSSAPALTSTTPTTTTTFTATTTVTTTVATVAPSTETETLLGITDDPNDIMPSTTATIEENTSEDVAATENYTEDSTQQEMESFPITVDEEGTEEYISDEFVPIEEQSDLDGGEDGTSTLPTPTTETTTSPSTAVRSTISQQKPPAARNHKPQTAVNIKGTSFIVSASQFPIRNPAVPLPPLQSSTSASPRTAATSYEKENLRGKKSRQQRLRKLNSRARPRPLAVVPTTTTTNATQEAVEGDTARALSWMIANVAKLMNENANMPVVDKVPIEKVDADTDQVLSRLPSGVEVISEQDRFILKEDASNDPVVKVDRQTSEDSGMTDGRNWFIVCLASG
ncbi:hypothetical protein ANCCAN_11525 [Ancylostoma caninum]|uniref:Uncharacterized protein n=1 Tax=Ancylostoma caninum TaxID=29170 RepID=A0A368GDP0_ANCCA|nr:hypothetical protein ANCCAN_11525 [Ancylostoma caninum]